MIKPIQNTNIAFKANEIGTTTVKSPSLVQFIETSKTAQTTPISFNAPIQADAVEKAPAEKTEKVEETVTQPTEAEEKATKKEKVKKEKKEKIPLKERWVGAFQNYNKAIKTFGGSIKGVLCAIPAMYATAIVGKNIQGNIKGGTVGDAICGVFSDIGKTITTIGTLFSKNVKSDHANNINGVIKYFKNAKVTAGAMVLVGAGVVAYNVIKSKIKANRQNADIDHTFYTNHKIKNKKA